MICENSDVLHQFALIYQKVDFFLPGNEAEHLQFKFGRFCKIPSLCCRVRYIIQVLYLYHVILIESRQ